MGNSQVQPMKEHLKDLQLIREDKQQNNVYLKSTTNDQQYLLHQTVYNDETIFSKNLKLYEQRKDITNDHLTSLSKFEKFTKDNLCSTIYKIYGLWNHASRTLWEEIEERIVQKRKFTEKQLLSIAASCILGLSQLQKNNILHEHLTSSTIFLTEDGMIKVSDPLILQCQTNFNKIKEKKSNSQNIYLSVEQCSALQSHANCIKSYKYDVWSLGMILIECGMMETQQKCYRDEYQNINWVKLEQNIVQIQQKYGNQLKNLIKLMLAKNKKDRPDWEELQAYVLKEKVEEKQRKTNPILLQSQHLSKQPPTNAPIFLNSQPKQNIVPLKPEVKNPPLSIPQNKPNYLSLNQPYQGPIIQGPLVNRPQISFHSTPYQPSSEVKMTSPQFNQLQSISFASLKPDQSIQMEDKVETKQYQIPKTQQSLLNLSKPAETIYSGGFYFMNSHENTQSRKKYGEKNDRQTFKTLISPSSVQGNFFGKHEYGQIVESQHISTVKEQWKKESQKEENLESNYERKEPVFGFPQSAKNAYSITYEAGPDKKQPQKLKETPLQKSKISPEKPNYESVIIRNSVFQTPKENVEEQDDYVIEEFKQGSRYEGFKRNGKRHGLGKFFYQDGGMYNGNWVQNKMEGIGSLYYDSGKPAYEGEWKNDQFFGKGKLYNEVPKPLFEMFDYCNFDEIDEHWQYYEGEFFEDLKQGRGKFMLSNGEYFIGEFENDCINGNGKFYRKNGSIIKGIWKQNSLVHQKH